MRKGLWALGTGLWPESKLNLIYMTDTLASTQSPEPGALNSAPSSSPCFATPLRRFGAMVYDTLLCIAILMVATLPFIPFANGRALVPEEAGALAYLYWLWLACSLFAFFGYFWTRKGRTLGMQVWKLRIETVESGLPSWSDALRRFAAACVPLMLITLLLAMAAYVTTIKLGVAITALLGVPVVSYLAGYFDAQRRALHERWLRTRIVRVQ